jgi:hypothetical protein
MRCNREKLLGAMRSADKCAHVRHQAEGETRDELMNIRKYPVRLLFASRFVSAEGITFSLVLILARARARFSFGARKGDLYNIWYRDYPRQIIDNLIFIAYHVVQSEPLQPCPSLFDTCFRQSRKLVYSQHGRSDFTSV